MSSNEPRWRPPAAGMVTFSGTVDLSGKRGPTREAHEKSHHQGSFQPTDEHGKTMRCTSCGDCISYDDYLELPVAPAQRGKNTPRHSDEVA